MIEASRETNDAQASTSPSNDWILRYASNAQFNIAAITLFGLAMFSPFILKGTHASLIVDDQLEQLDRFGPLAGGAPIHSSWHLEHLLAHHLGVFWGIVANELVYRSVALAGMYLLLQRLTRRYAPPRLVITLVACAFAALPFWPQGDLSVAGLPLAVVAFVQLRDRSHIASSCLALAAFAYHSHLSLSGLPLIILSSLWAAVELLRGRFHPPVLLGLLVLCAGYIAIYWLNPSMSRIAALAQIPISATTPGDPLSDTVLRTRRLLTDSVYLADSNHATVMLPTAIACVGYLIGKRCWSSRRTALGVLSFAALANFWFAAHYSQFLRSASSILQWTSELRWYFLLPAAWYLAWGTLLANVVACATSRRSSTLVVLALAALQVMVNASETAVRNMFARPSFEEFVAQDLFGQITKAIELKSGERVGCIGFHPAAARYNSMDTIGSAVAESTEQKEMVRKIIGKGLAHSIRLRDYYERPTARVYLLDDEIGPNVGDQRKLRKKLNAITPDYDLAALKEARVKYLLSTLPFREPEKAGYKLVFKGASSYYQMFVYQVY